MARRRNFRLSGLEISIVVLIILGVAYLVTMWAGAAFSPESEPAPAATPGVLMEKALAVSEKVQAQLSSLNRDLGALRKDLDALQGRRSDNAPAALGKQHSSPSNALLGRRLDEVEKQLQALSVHKDDKPLAGRLDRLERDLASRALPDNKSAVDTRLAAGPQLQARIERLEQALAQTRKEAPSELTEMESRLSKLEQGLKQVNRDLAWESARAAASQEGVAAHPAAASKPAAVDQRKITCKVKIGDTMLGLAHRYRVSMDDIVRWNAQQLGDRRNLLIGETLAIIPGPNS